jgi:hypothetical protein
MSGTGSQSAHADISYEADQLAADTGLSSYVSVIVNTSPIASRFVDLLVTHDDASGTEPCVDASLLCMSGDGSVAGAYWKTVEIKCGSALFFRSTAVR